MPPLRPGLFGGGEPSVSHEPIPGARLQAVPGCALPPGLYLLPLHDPLQHTHVLPEALGEISLVGTWDLGHEDELAHVANPKCHRGP